MGKVDVQPNTIFKNVPFPLLLPLLLPILLIPCKKKKKCVYLFLVWSGYVIPWCRWVAAAGERRECSTIAITSLVGFHVPAVGASFSPLQPPLTDTRGITGLKKIGKYTDFFFFLHRLVSRRGHFFLAWLVLG